MKRILIIVFLIVLVVFTWQLYQLYAEYRDLNNDYSVIDDKWNNLREENLNLQADLEYFSEPENLEKELRGRFNYKKPGEKLIIIVPPKEE